MKDKATQEPGTPRTHQFEFFRQGMALMPEPSDKRPGVAFFVPGNAQCNQKGQLTQRFCTCNLSGSKTCPHLKHLTKAFKALHQKSDQTLFEDRFRFSIWYHLAAILGKHPVKPNRWCDLEPRQTEMNISSKSRTQMVRPCFTTFPRARTGCVLWNAAHHPFPMGVYQTVPGSCHAYPTLPGPTTKKA